MKRDPESTSGPPWKPWTLTLEPQLLPLRTGTTAAVTLAIEALAVLPGRIVLGGDQAQLGISTAEYAAAGTFRDLSDLALPIGCVVALVLAAVGVYGVMAYSVAARTREIGVRVALGAQPSNVFGMIVRQGLGSAVAGLTIGLLGAAALGRVLTKLLYGVAPTDAPTFIGVAAVLLAVTLAACLVPAWRAVRVDPLEALRSE